MSLLNHTHCASSAIPYPVVFGAEILHLTAEPVYNFSREVSDQLYYNHPSISVKNVDFCNVTVSYTHNGQDDNINVETWLPLDTWNGRLQAVGGGGYVAGRFPLSNAAMAGAVGNGYVTTSTDAGLGSSYVPDPWAQVGKGNVDLFALQNLASVSLNDQATIAKSIVESFYGRRPDYSYWSGCSQGGRQGFMLAQRYPQAYDGIAASAPAINWAEFMPQTAWAQVLMNIMGAFPHPCELDAITDAVIEACGLSPDNVTDNLYDPEPCHFDPFSVVGRAVNCSRAGQNMTVGFEAATIANAIWNGPRTEDDKFLWFGPNPQARLTGAAELTGITSDIGLAMTTCNETECHGVPTELGEAWLKFFVQKDPQWNYTMIKSVDEFSRLFRQSVNEFDSLIGTSSADLSEFRDVGGKMITYHGQADGIIPTRGTKQYYDRAMSFTPDIQDFFRYFEVPGLEHCAGGNGGQPTRTFQALIDWVEHGIAPDTLPVSKDGDDCALYNRFLSPYQGQNPL
ncbi:tannase and feruloyl esterase [Hortaea werneckii]|nr:tannase and feruloyl esterase [Hortaea werneckii]KAI7003245.1 tannase and feruloyl esterase [Hortaea werneckii]KAI7199831.1 tannase and feruloyl esterase [Hortaea werneckii]KAI7593307.1 tannase and feruloyl esterase [Hortaea werneckii]